MTADPKGRGLFIVDNSISGWTGLRYLEEWAGNTRRLMTEIDEVIGKHGGWPGAFQTGEGIHALVATDRAV